MQGWGEVNFAVGVHVGRRKGNGFSSLVFAYWVLLSPSAAALLLMLPSSLPLMMLSNGSRGAAFLNGGFFEDKVVVLGFAEVLRGCHWLRPWLRERERRRRRWLDGKGSK